MAVLAVDSGAIPRVSRCPRFGSRRCSENGPENGFSPETAHKLQLAAVKISERTARSVLSKTGIPGARWALNPYIGCAHACRYCYAEFMKKYTGHTEPWGTFVDAKVNAPEALERELRRAVPGVVMLSSVTDCYQPLEERYRLTRRCLERLLAHRFPVRILTKSPLVLRDLDLLRQFPQIEVGLTVTTDDERMRCLFEPGAPQIAARVDALRRLQEAGVRTYVFIGPMLPMNPARLAAMLRGCVGETLVDPMNYAGKTRTLFRRLGEERWLDPAFTVAVADELLERLRGPDPAGA
jgi:DNA repair photolyase